MSLVLESGLIEFGAGATTRWSSADKNLLRTNFISSSFVINSKNPGSGSIIQTETTTLGPVATNASVIMGQYIVDSRTYSIGGTRIHFKGKDNMANAASYTRNLTGANIFSKAVWYWLEITGGNLIAKVEYRFPAGAAAFTGTTVQVRAIIGGFEF
jgi:hypothetical protein